MNPYVGAIAAVGLLAAGFGAGHKVAIWQANGRIQSCATEISTKTNSKGCPQPLVDALNTVAFGQTKVQLEYRDRVVPILSRDTVAAQARTEKLLADIAELSKEEPTHACAASPAFERRRLQLCATEGGPGCPAGAGAADEDPR